MTTLAEAVVAGESTPVIATGGQCPTGLGEPGYRVVAA